MTEEQRKVIDDARARFKRSDFNTHGESLLMFKIIDAQEAELAGLRAFIGDYITRDESGLTKAERDAAELQAARATIAQYEAMIHSMGDYLPMIGDNISGHVWLQRVAGEWGWNYRDVIGMPAGTPVGIPVGARHGGGFATALDAYEALKEATR